MIQNNSRRAMAAGSAASSLTAVGWPAGYSVDGTSFIDDIPPFQMRVNGGNPGHLTCSVTLADINDSADVYIYVHDAADGTGTNWGMGDISAFNATTDNLPANPCWLALMVDYTGSNILPRTITVNFYDGATLLDSVNITFNPPPE